MPSRVSIISLAVFAAAFLSGCHDESVFSFSKAGVEGSTALYRVINPGHALRDVHHTVLFVTGSDSTGVKSEYLALVGPYPDKFPGATIDPATSLFYDKPAEESVLGLSPDQPEIDLESGYAYVCGTRPLTRTRRTRTTSTGTTYLVQIEKDSQGNSKFERVFLIDCEGGSKVTVTRLATGTSPNTSIDLTKPGDYAEIDDHDNITVYTLPATGDLRDWVDQTATRAKAAGVK